MRRGRIMARVGTAMMGAVMVAAVLSAGLWSWRAKPSELEAVSDVLLRFGTVGLVFMVGVVIGGLWLGGVRGAEDDPGGPGPGDPTPPDPTVLPADDLDHELELLLSGHWPGTPTQRVARNAGSL